MKLSVEQITAINHIEGPALTLAVPGSGKTTLLLHRILHLVRLGVDSSEILTITFSKSAQLDMKKRFEELSESAYLKPQFSTIHAFSYRILRDYYQKKGRTMYLIDDSGNSKYEILKNIYFKINHRNVGDENLEQIISKISYYKNSLEIPSNRDAKIINFVKIFDEYEKYKSENNLIDFDDMVPNALFALKEDGALRNKYKSMYKFIQLDEGQDTSVAQFEFLRYLTSPHHNLFIVADDDQSIYKFRGASPEYLLNIKNIYKNVKFYYLQYNFRSSKNIVDTSDIFIKTNKSRFDKNISTINNFYEPVNIIKVDDNTSQYKFIEDMYLKNPNLSYAVVYRNNLSSLGLVEYFERNGRDFSIKGNRLKFFNHFVVRDVLNIIKFSYNNNDIDLFSEIYYKINGYISKNHILFLQRNSKGDVLKSLLNYPNLPAYYKDNIYSLIHDFKKLKSLKVNEQIDYVLDFMGYNTYLKDFANKFGYSYTSLAEFIHYLRFIASSSNNLEDLIGRLKHLESILSKPDVKKTNLTFSTIHSVKGLEFDCVFVIDIVDGVIPSNLGEDEQDLEEERRLFYVAMTRARQHLYLIAPKNHNSQTASLSPFIEEISKY